MHCRTTPNRSAPSSQLLACSRPAGPPVCRHQGGSCTDFDRPELRRTDPLIFQPAPSSVVSRMPSCFPSPDVSSALQMTPYRCESNAKLSSHKPRSLGAVFEPFPHRVLLQLPHLGHVLPPAMPSIVTTWFQSALPLVTISRTCTTTCFPASLSDYPRSSRPRTYAHCKQKQRRLHRFVGPRVADALDDALNVAEHGRRLSHMRDRLPFSRGHGSSR